MNNLEQNLQTLNVMTLSQISQHSGIFSSFSEHFKQVATGMRKTLTNTSLMVGMAVALSVGGMHSAKADDTTPDASALTNAAAAQNASATAPATDGTTQDPSQPAPAPKKSWSIGGLMGSAVTGITSGAKTIGTHIDDSYHTIQAKAQGTNPNANALGQYQDPVTGKMVSVDTSSCVRMWNGDIKPSTPIESNPAAKSALDKLSVNLKTTHDSYFQAIQSYNQLKNNQQWNVPANPAEQAQANKNMTVAAQQLSTSEQAYLFSKNTAIQKFDLAADQGLDITSYKNAVIPFLSMQAPNQVGYVGQVQGANATPNNGTTGSGLVKTSTGNGQVQMKFGN